MKRAGFLATLSLAGFWLACDTSQAWAQTAPPPEKGQTERKKGEGEMEARGAQKPGRMEKPGAHVPEAEQNPGEKWTKQDIQKAQEALKSKGHDPGSVDGVLGPKTRQALKAFQSASGLKETGSLDSETAKKLGVDKGAGAKASAEAAGK